MLRTYVANIVRKAHTLRKPLAAQTALNRQSRLLVLGVAFALGLACAVALLLIGCRGGSSAAIPPPPPTPAFEPLTQSEVTQIVTA
ncbi:MAG TPA: hypothetical protein VM781_01030, partial [Candidatus Bathyarchaeia archaeon]|nr:hypothetical protein [Candidatus Bathyarchaeia archaeon]